MASSSLRLRFYDDGDGTGKLFVRAEAGGFAGESSAYFHKHELEAFATKLEAYPLVERVSIAGGYYDSTGSPAPGTLAEELVALECYPLDVRGNVGVHVRLMAEGAPGGARNRVALEISTLYPALHRFSGQLRALVSGTIEEAVLGDD